MWEVKEKKRRKNNNDDETQRVKENDSLKNRVDVNVCICIYICIYLPICMYMYLYPSLPTRFFFYLVSHQVVPGERGKYKT